MNQQREKREQKGVNCTSVIVACHLHFPSLRGNHTDKISACKPNEKMFRLQGSSFLHVNSSYACTDRYNPPPISTNDKLIYDLVYNSGHQTFFAYCARYHLLDTKMTFVCILLKLWQHQFFGPSLTENWVLPWVFGNRLIQRSVCACVVSSKNSSWTANELQFDAT